MNQGVTFQEDALVDFAVRREFFNKVPEVTLAFWAIKILSTTVGETGADYLAVHVGLGTALTDAVMVTLLAASLLIQLQARRYVPWKYWLTVVLVSVVGTQITDALTDKLDISLYVSTTFFSVILAAIFLVPHGANALHSGDRYASPRVLLLGGDTFHLRAGNGSG
jgi:uncharacterized membrane-anchored protein